MKESRTEATFFSSPAELRQWFRRNHRGVPELWIGFHKKHTGVPSITWAESVDEALCFGWIDGIRKGIDAASYKIRFTPRRRGSIWSKINIGRVEALTKAKRMHASGLAAFDLRRENKSGTPTNNATTNCPNLTRASCARTRRLGIFSKPSRLPIAR
jgi:uncharacterized protein YdeI (YjbR/CyaY-like superfamily)